MSIDIDKVIQQAVKKLTEEQALRRLTLLNILHINIDILIQNSFAWFEDDIPDEYRQVINSLMSLTTSFLEGEVNFEEMLLDQAPDIINIASVLTYISDEMNTLFGFADSRISIEAEDNFQLIAPKKELTREIYHVLLAVTPFMGEESRCTIKVMENHSNIMISMGFLDLNDKFPGIGDLKKAFFTYNSGESSKVAMGLNSAIIALKEMGAQVSVKYLQGGNNIAVIISFPSMAFMKTLEEIRKKSPGSIESLEAGEGVIIVVNDRIIEMLLQELLTGRGYEAVRTSVSKYRSMEKPEQWKGIVIDWDYIADGFTGFEEFVATCEPVEKIIILFDDTGDVHLPVFTDKRVIVLKKPIEVDAIVKHFED